MAQRELALMSSLLLLLTWLHPLDAQGRLWDPPGRSTMWRRGFNTPVNHNDMMLNCGGFDYHNPQNYKCGICGDPYNGARDNEAGGLYATGTISRTYQQGQNVDFQVDLTHNQKGYFEFKLCATNDTQVEVTQECLNGNPVPLANGNGYRFYPPHNEHRIFNISVVLPPDLYCSHCVLQWRYNTGKDWGTNADGTSCTGCGPQEQFYGCADVTIQKSGPVVCLPTVTYETVPGMVEWCRINCGAGFCPNTTCICN